MFNPNDVRYCMPQAYKVSPKEEAFCVAIVSGSNASDAYRTAYRPQRAKAKTIHEKASRLMAKGKVQARIRELMAPVIAQAQMTRTEWLQRLTSCCRYDARRMFDVHGKPTPMTELDENEAAAIEQYELHAELPTTDGSRKAFTVKVKYSDRLSALALLGKACHWYADRQEQSGPDGGPVPKSIILEFVRPPSTSPEEAYHRIVDGSSN